MHGAWSVLVFTVLSGAGLGALALIALVDLAATTGCIDRLLPPDVGLAIVLAALALVIVGLCSSVLHLANPRNAWRSAARFRTSWLSREAVFAVAFLAVSATYALAWWLGAGNAARATLALAVIALAWTVLYCTAMIYASLKPIRAWHTARVPLTFFVMGHASGALLVVAVMGAAGSRAGALASVAMALFALVAAIKFDYWRYVAGNAGAVTLEQALGVAHGVGPPGRTRMSARLLDTGHSRGTFLTREFVNTPATLWQGNARLVFWIAGIALPVVWLAVGLPQWHGGTLAFAACIIGFLAERWLFFAQARHTVRLYHGERRT